MTGIFSFCTMTGIFSKLAHRQLSFGDKTNANHLLIVSNIRVCKIWCFGKADRFLVYFRPVQMKRDGAFVSSLRRAKTWQRSHGFLPLFLNAHNLRAKKNNLYALGQRFSDEVRKVGESQPRCRPRGQNAMPPSAIQHKCRQRGLGTCGRSLCAVPLVTKHPLDRASFSARRQTCAWNMLDSLALPPSQPALPKSNEN